LRIKKVLKTFV